MNNPETVETLQHFLQAVVETAAIAVLTMLLPEATAVQNNDGVGVVHKVAPYSDTATLVICFVKAAIERVQCVESRAACLSSRSSLEKQGCKLPSSLKTEIFCTLSLLNCGIFSPFSLMLPVTDILL